MSVMQDNPQDNPQEIGNGMAPEDITFLMVGCQRCGSTWVDKALRDHPEIHLPPQKQTYFFDSNYDDGMEWYLEQYGSLKEGATAIGEIATSYCLTEVLPLVAKELPHIKIIMSVRDPVERAISFYNSRKDKFGWTSIEQAIAEDPQIIERGHYAEQIETILKHFPKDRFLLLFYDDLVADDRAYLKSILRFLGVDETWESPALGQRIQVSAFGRSRKLARKLGAGRLVDATSRSWIGDRVRRRLARKAQKARKAPAPSATPSREAAYLAPLFTSNLDQLREHAMTQPQKTAPDAGYGKNWDPNEWYKETAIAEEYDRTRFSSLAGRTFDALEKRALLKAFSGLPKGATIIDAPCGTGRLAETLLEAGYNVIGLDIAAPMLDVARRKLARFGDRFQCHVRDVRQMDAGEFQADAVLCARVLMHFPLEEQIDFLKSVAALSNGPVVFNQSLSTPWHRARRRMKRALGNQTPASYPLIDEEVRQLIEGAGLAPRKTTSVQPLVSEAVFWSCERIISDDSE